jgi:hypothetical protein
MAYDESVAARLRIHFADRDDVVEKKMFGGIAFMVRGHMCVGVVRDELMARVGPDQHAAAITRPNARPMDFTGRPMKGFIYVAPQGFATASALSDWVRLCEAFVSTLPPK